MIFFWDTALCSLVEVDLMKEAVRASEASVYFNETTRHYIPEGYHLFRVLAGITQLTLSTQILHIW
jgi:hypothetical protein